MEWESSSEGIGSKANLESDEEYNREQNAEPLDRQTVSKRLDYYSWFTETARRIAIQSKANTEIFLFSVQ